MRRPKRLSPRTPVIRNHGMTAALLYQLDACVGKLRRRLTLRNLNLESNALAGHLQEPERRADFHLRDLSIPDRASRGGGIRHHAWVEGRARSASSRHRRTLITSKRSPLKSICFTGFLPLSLSRLRWSRTSIQRISPSE